MAEDTIPEVVVDTNSDGDLDGIPASALEGDSELKEMLDNEKPAPKKGAVDKGHEEDNGSDGESDPNNSGADDDEKEIPDGADADDKNPGEESVDDLEFDDDVIPGLKGEFLKTLPREALEALAAFVEKNKTDSTKMTSAEKSLSELLADPIVKKRNEQKAKGKLDYEVRGINETEKASIIKRLKDRTGLDDAEAENAFEAIKEGVDVAIKDAAKDTLQNMILEDDSKRQQDEIMKKGRSALIGLGKFNKALQFKETDPNKFWKSDGKGNFVLDESHPESRLFGEKILPAMDALAKKGFRYEHLSKMSEKQVYSLVAEELGLPVAFNTEERDKKIAYDTRKNLASLLKKGSSGELSVNGGTNVAQSKSKAVIKSGYDLERLAEGGAYYEKALTAKGTDQKHMQMIEDLAEEGAALLEKKQKPKK